MSIPKVSSSSRRYRKDAKIATMLSAHLINLHHSIKAESKPIRKVGNSDTNFYHAYRPRMTVLD